MKLLDISYLTDRSAEQPDGCWLWQLFVDKCGYGKVTVNGVKGRPAHRVAYEIVNGPIPEGMTVDHLCFTRACVNPTHLRLLTRSANSRNKQPVEPQTHCKNGHEFTPENTYFKTANSSGNRQCRACNRQAVARLREKRNAA